MKHNLFMLSLFLAVQMAGSGLLAQTEPGVLKREENEKGWFVPGIKDLDHRNVTGKRTEIIDGILINITTYFPFADERATVSRTDSSGKQIEVNVVVNGIVRFDVAGKAFCYLIDTSGFSGGNGGPGGVLGSIAYYVFYDEKGQGIFQTRVLPNMVLGSRDLWHVRLPAWVKRASQKQ